jgi:hypothetical protein
MKDDNTRWKRKKIKEKHGGEKKINERRWNKK